MTKVLILLLVLLVAFPFEVFAEADASDFDLHDFEGKIEQHVNTLPEYAGLFDSFNRGPVVFKPSDLLNPRDWKSQFENVIWINKSDKGPTAQTLRAFVRGELKLETLISTGREEQEISAADAEKVLAPAPVEEPKRKWWKFGRREKAPEPVITAPTPVVKPGLARSYFSGTPTGYYTPQHLSRDHVSSLWQVEMPFAIFFTGGIAIHQAPNDVSERKLGTRASGGCIRISKNYAPWLFETVLATKAKIPKFKVTGRPLKAGNGDFERRSGYSTLVIVEDRAD